MRCLSLKNKCKKYKIMDEFAQIVNGKMVEMDM
jgi:hypothetical protein